VSLSYIYSKDEGPTLVLLIIGY